MAISDTQKIDLLYKKLFGVAKTDIVTNKGASNESIPSPAINRGDTIWTQSGNIPSVASPVSGIVQGYQLTNKVETSPDTTSVSIGGVYPTWKTNLIDLIPPEF